jgi:hypothetical protein
MWVILSPLLTELVEREREKKQTCSYLRQDSATVQTANFSKTALEELL